MPFLAFQSWGDVSILCSLAAVSFANWNESILCIFVLCALLLLIILNKKTRVHMSYGLISVQFCTNKKEINLKSVIDDYKYGIFSLLNNNLQFKECLNFGAFIDAFVNEFYNYM